VLGRRAKLALVLVLLVFACLSILGYAYSLAKSWLRSYDYTLHSWGTETYDFNLFDSRIMNGTVRVGERVPVVLLDVKLTKMDESLERIDLTFHISLIRATDYPNRSKAITTELSHTFRSTDVWKATVEMTFNRTLRFGDQTVIMGSQYVGQRLQLRAMWIWDSTFHYRNGTVIAWPFITGGGGPRITVENLQNLSLTLFLEDAAQPIGIAGTLSTLFVLAIAWRRKTAERGSILIDRSFRLTEKEVNISQN